MHITIKMKNNFRQLIATSTALFFMSFVVLFPVYAADTAEVTATVTVQNISVSVADGTVAYGILALNSSEDTNPGDTQTATNDGNVTVEFNIQGQDSANWTLAGTAGANQYVHRFCTSSCGTPPTNYTALTTSYDTLAASVAPAGNQTFDLSITTPTSTASYAQQNVDVTVQAALP